MTETFGEQRIGPGLVTLVVADPAYSDAWWTWRQQPSARAHMPLEPLTADQLAARLKAAGSDLADVTKPEYRWMVRYQDSIVGTVAVTKPSWKMGHCEISYMIDELFQGRGLGKAAVRCLVDLVMRVDTMHKLIAITSVDNVSSIAVLQSTGFVLEGRLREHFLIEGRRIDQLQWGLLRREWEQISTETTD